MDISDDKMNVYKDLARKCESFELFKWIVGDKESWMTEAGKAETETMLKTIYNGVHITDRQRLFVDMDGTLAEFKTVDTLETLYRIVTDSVTMHSTKNDNSGEYDIEITEVLQKVVSTKAASLQEAIQDVEEQYHNSEIILDADDLKETTIEAAHPQLDEEITTDLRGIFL